MTSRPEPPFAITFSILRAGGFLPVPALRPFVIDAELAEPVCAFDEFEHLRVQFDCAAPEAVLTLEGFEKEIRAGSTADVVSNADHELDAYPWYPGIYELRVSTGGRLWYGLFHIRPRHLPGLDDLERLRHDLEALVAGLSLDLSLNRGYMGRHRAQPRAGAPPLRLGQLSLLKQALSAAEPALRHIAQAPQRRLGREHAVVPWQHARRLDGPSLRWLARGQGLRQGQAISGSPWSGGGGAVLAPRAVPSIDTYENRVVAFILGVFHDRAHHLLAALEQDLVIVKEDLRLARANGWSTHMLAERYVGYQRTLRLVQEAAATLTEQRRQPWLAGVGRLDRPPRPTAILRRDPRYRTLFQWYRRLAGALVRVDTGDAAFALRAKRTSMLYEYWCLLRMIDLLGGIGFSLQGGWLSQQLRRLTRDRLVPVIPAGAEFELVGPGERRLLVVYDRELPQTVAAAVAAGQAFYIASNRNRPDIRIDLFQAGRYQRSLVFDAKYSRASSIWDEHRYGERMAQLQSYVYNLFHVVHPGRQIVRAAVALYPGRGADPEWQEREAGRIALARLAPGGDNAELLRRLREFVGEAPP